LENAIEILTLLLISSVKFIWAFPVAQYEYHLRIYETILITSSGGIIGILFFAFLSDFLIRLWFKFYHRSMNHRFTIKILPEFLKKKYNTKKLVFTRKNKRYIRVKQKFGIIGVSFLTPILLSIPIGTFIAVRFYKRKLSTIIYLISSVVLWSLIISFSMYFFKVKIF
jgi:hypothetical protein